MRLKHNTAHIKLDGVLLNWGNIFCKHPYEIRFRNLSMLWKDAGGSKVALRQVTKTVKNLENRKVRNRSHKWCGQKGSGREAEAGAGAVAVSVAVAAQS
ncbi:hypothetical protein SDJN03_07302, partial [Cucurbita argyrosperma subsp. sororia]